MFKHTQCCAFQWHGLIKNILFQIKILNKNMFSKMFVSVKIVPKNCIFRLLKTVGG